ncbi:hypothetical protein K2173_005728 [Erythroxylum novogranatense]|uniref:E3 ubiquitin-protein ligase RMA n=1 Tax=Erythroxylum novogranatense TaxID=1862640 RepID=A0AAV8SQJ5_9ROSI|nr:hypothetical protein K2173_005728 [Erythroxylum novogranatense]
MDDETSDIMNLDLNLRPGPEASAGSVPREAVNLIRAVVDDPIEGIRDAVRIRARQRWSWQQDQIPRETQSLSVELDQLVGNYSNMSTLQTGEGSIIAEERRGEVTKMYEHNNGFLDDQVLGKKNDVEKGTGNDGSFFDCNIYFDLAVLVTCFVNANECPVCKGEASIKNVTPIYGRGNNIRQPEEDSSLEIPLTPPARRVESLRQSIQSSFNFPVEEMIWRLGSRFDMIRDLTAIQDPDGDRETADRTNSFHNRIMTSRGVRAEQNPITPPDDISELIPSSTVNPDTLSARRLHSLLLRRMQSRSQRSSTHSLYSSAFSAEGLVEAYFRNHSVGRNRGQPQPVDDRDSFSSITAVINSDSQMDTALEIDSLVSFSNSSSRRMNDVSRVSDADRGDSRAPRRRRLN